MNHKINSAAPLVPAITSSHLEKNPMQQFPFWYNFDIKQLLFIQTGATFVVAYMAALQLPEGREVALSPVLGVPCLVGGENKSVTGFCE